MDRKPREVYVFREYAEAVCVAVLIALLLRAFVISAYKIPTGSMVPTLKVGDCIFAWKLPYGVRLPFTNLLLVKPQLPKRGDVVVFKFPEDKRLSFVKRVAGVPGDKIQIKDRKLFINDVPLKYGDVEAKDVKIIDDIPSKDIYQVQQEFMNGMPHFVVFHRNKEDDAYGPVVVPEGKLFVLGDNRDSSDDSRSWGMVPLENIEGRSVMIWTSLDWEHRLKFAPIPKLRFERLFTLIR